MTLVFRFNASGISSIVTEFGTFTVKYIVSYSDAPHTITGLLCGAEDVSDLYAVDIVR